MAGQILEHRKFVCVEFEGSNNNKVWQYTLYNDGTALTEWGRIGKTLQSKTTTHHDALSKMRQKTNPDNAPDKYYTEVKVAESTQDTAKSSGKSVNSSDLRTIAKQQIKISNPLLSELIDYLVQTNAHNIYQASGGKIRYDSSSATFQTPLGVIVPEQVSEARTILNKIADFIYKNNHDDSDLSPLLKQYLRLIPHDVGMSRISAYSIFPDTQALQKENDLLDGLDSSFADITTAPKQKKTTKQQDTAPTIFQVNMNLVDDDKIVTWIKNLYQRTRSSMHLSNSLSVHKVYELDIKTVREAFNKFGKQINNVKKLWHGTKASNLLSILKGGLIIPPSSSSHVTGRMFGNGIYGSDISTKALNYATNYWNGGGRIDRTFMLLCDFAMGKTYVSNSYCDYRTPKDGYDSTFAKGGSGSGVQNNEMIVYRTDQVDLLYLVEFRSR